MLVLRDRRTTSRHVCWFEGIEGQHYDSHVGSERQKNSIEQAENTCRQCNFRGSSHQKVSKTERSDLF